LPEIGKFSRSLREKDRNPQMMTKRLFPSALNGIIWTKTGLKSDHTHQESVFFVYRSHRWNICSYSWATDHIT